MKYGLVTARKGSNGSGLCAWPASRPEETNLTHAGPICFEGSMIVNIKGYPVQIDNEDAHFLEEYRWCPKNCGPYKYKKIYLCRTKWNLRLHRLIMRAQKGQEVDHIDGNTLNNKKDNLRFCTHAQNLHNTRKRKINTSGLKGVFRNHKRWMARIKWENKDFYLGTFDTREEAHEAYKAAAIKYAGEFARW